MRLFAPALFLSPSLCFVSRNDFLTFTFCCCVKHDARSSNRTDHRTPSLSSSPRNIVTGTAFEGGIYHGRILLPVDYPFKPPNFMLLTPNGRFETLTKICLSITSYHEEHWQPSWSVRTALTAIRAFMVTPSEGALGGIDFSEEQRRELAEKSRANEVNFTFGSEKRREVTRLIHEKMLGRMGKAKQAAKKMAMEARERKEKEARERSSAQNGDDNNAEVRTTTTQAVAEEVPQRAPVVVSPPTRVSSAHLNQQQQQQQQQQHAEPGEDEHHQAPSPTRTPRNANAAATYQRPPAPADNNRRTQPPEDDRTSAIKLLDSLSVCLIVAIAAILLKRCMWVPPL